MPKTKSDMRFDRMIQKIQHGTMRMTEADAIRIAGELYLRGQFGQVVNVCKQVISTKPGLADAHGILGVALAALGKDNEGIASVRRAIKLNPRAANFQSNLGELLRKRGEAEEARECLSNAISIAPSNSQAHNNLGIVHYELGDIELSIDSYRKAIQLDPDFPEAYNNLGNALRKLGEIDEAKDAYDKALALRSNYAEAYNNLGTLLREQHKAEQAEEALKKAIQCNPRYVDAYNNLASIYHGDSKDVEALGQLQQALKIDPECVRSLLLTARIQLRRGAYEPAERACRHILNNDPESVEALTVLGSIKHELDDFDTALAMLSKAVELNPESAEARNFYGVCLKSVGRLDEAKEQFLQALEANSSLYGAFSNLNDLVDFSKDSELFDKMEVIMETVEDQRAVSLLPLHFAYAKGLDDNKQHEKALEHYIIGGQIKRTILDYDENKTYGFFKAIKEAFPASYFSGNSYEGSSDERPLFIVGMPRSGSTLVEQILASHDGIYGAGEVKYFSQAMARLVSRFEGLARYPGLVSQCDDTMLNLLGKDYISSLVRNAGSASRVTDKLLTNYFFVGFLHTLFPKAKFINTRRNPVDTCLSAFTKLFKDDMPHSYDLTELGRYYREYDSLMKHWESVLPAGVMRTVQYEDVVADTETQARQLIDFVGLDWDEKCLDFHKSKRPVKTASVAQVRKPIYKTSVERWRRYGEGLQPLIDALEI